MSPETGRLQSCREVCELPRAWIPQTSDLRAQVSAGKSSCSNARLIENLGTIEVIALRCNPALSAVLSKQQLERAPPGRDVLPSKKANHSKRNTQSKAPVGVEAKKSSLKPVKKAPSSHHTAASNSNGGFGGLAGLFDGCCDEKHPWESGHSEAAINAGPYPGDTRADAPTHLTYLHHAKPSTEEMRTTPRNPSPDYYNSLEQPYITQLDGAWDEEVPSREPSSARGRHADNSKPRFQRGSNDRIAYRFKTKEDAVWAQRAIADDAYKARLFKVVDDSGRYEQNIEGLRLMESDIELMKQALSKAKQENPTRDLTHQWNLMSVLNANFKILEYVVTGKAPRKRQLEVMPPIMDAILADIEIMRNVVRSLKQRMSSAECQHCEKTLDELEKEGRMDTALRSSPGDTLSGLQTKVVIQQQRLDLLRKFQTDFVQQSPDFKSEAVDKRIRDVLQEQRQFRKKIDALQDQIRGDRMPDLPANRRHNEQKNTASEDAGTWKLNNNPGWQPVGSGTWLKETQESNQNSAVSSSEKTIEHFFGEPLEDARGWKQSDQNQTNRPSGSGRKPNNGSASRPKIASGRGARSGQWAKKEGAAADEWAGLDTVKSSKHDNNEQWAPADAQNDEHGWGKANNKNPRDSGGRKDVKTARFQAWGTDNHGDTGAVNDGWKNDDKAHRGRKATERRVPPVQPAANDGWKTDDKAHRGRKATEHRVLPVQPAANDGWKTDDKAHRGRKTTEHRVPPVQPAANDGWKTDDKVPSRRKATEHRAPPVQPVIKSYWREWNRRSTNSADLPRDQQHREVYNYPASRLPKVPEDKAGDASHGIQTSRGAQYTHVCQRPTYIDTMEAPYAIFSFKYRSKQVLQKLLNNKNVESDLRAIEEQAKKASFMLMPKEKLVERLMKEPSHSKRGETSSAEKQNERKQRSATQHTNRGAAEWAAGEKNDNGWASGSKAGPSQASSNRDSSGWGGRWQTNQTAVFTGAESEQNGGGAFW